MSKAAIELLAATEGRCGNSSHELIASGAAIDEIYQSSSRTHSKKRSIPFEPLARYQGIAPLG